MLQPLCSTRVVCFLPFGGWPRGGGAASGPQTAVRSPLAWALPIPEIGGFPWPPVPVPPQISAQERPSKETIRRAIDRLTGSAGRACTEEGEVSKSVCCAPSKLPARRVLSVFVIFSLPTSSILGIAHITSIEKAEKFLTFKHETVMVEFWTEGARCSRGEQ